MKVRVRISLADEVWLTRPSDSERCLDDTRPLQIPASPLYHISMRLFHRNRPLALASAHRNPLCISADSHDRQPRLIAAIGGNTTEPPPPPPSTDPGRPKCSETLGNARISEISSPSGKPLPLPARDIPPCPAARIRTRPTSQSNRVLNAKGLVTCHSRAGGNPNPRLPSHPEPSPQNPSKHCQFHCHLYSGPICVPRNKTRLPCPTSSPSGALCPHWLHWK